MNPNARMYEYAKHNPKRPYADHFPVISRFTQANPNPIRPIILAMNIFIKIRALILVSINMGVIRRSIARLGKITKLIL
jgi:hypothetical protein